MQRTQSSEVDWKLNFTSARFLSLTLHLLSLCTYFFFLHWRWSFSFFYSPRSTMADNSILPECAYYISIYLQDWYFFWVPVSSSRERTVDPLGLRTDSYFNQPWARDMGHETKGLCLEFSSMAWHSRKEDDIGRQCQIITSVIIINKHSLCSGTLYLSVLLMLFHINSCQ